MSHSDQDILGNVDRFVAGRYLGGWVVDKNDAARADIEVQLRFDSVVVSSVVAKLARGDGYHGFQIPYDKPDLAALLLDGRVQVTVESHAGLKNLHFYGPMLELAKQFVASEGAAPSSKTVEATKEGERQAALSPEELSFLRVPVGFESPDGSAIMGRDGYIFLYRGSNDVRSMYEATDSSPSVIRTAQRWYEIFESRKELLGRTGIGYIQMIIPEKNSILADKAPLDIRSTTPLFNSVERIVGTGAGSYYFPLVDTLRNVAAGSAFLRTDSHLSTVGCRAIIADILGRLAGTFPLEQQKIENLDREISLLGIAQKPLVFSGDLSERFGFKVCEILNPLDTSMLVAFGHEISDTKVHERPDDGHTGTHIVWRNPKAPLQFKVIAFANSFFERGSAPRGLSWWFKHIFSEFHFVWRADLDFEYVSLQKPDLVVCQTIERFLGVLPKV
jgi:hypothetical protein